MSESEVTQSCPTLCDPTDSTRLLRPWDFPGKSTGVGCHFLLQGIFPTQGSNPGLPHCSQTLYHLSQQGAFSITILISASKDRQEALWKDLEAADQRGGGGQPSPGSCAVAGGGRAPTVLVWGTLGTPLHISSPRHVSPSLHAKMLTTVFTKYIPIRCLIWFSKLPVLSKRESSR